MITSREAVRAAYVRALELDPAREHDAAVAATAHALGLQPDTVRDVVETVDCEALS